jgi:hypothetical protein
MGLTIGNTNTIGAKRRRFPSVLLDGNTVGWYDSQLLSTITKDGSDFVSQWNDRLGSGHDLIQSTGTNQPLWFAGNGILFDGIDNYMMTAPFTFNQPEMIYIVFKQITWSALFDRVFDGDSAVSGVFYQVVATPTLGIFAGGSVVPNGNLPLDTFGIARALFDGVSSKLTINQTTPSTGNVGASNMGGFTIGSEGGGAARFSHIQVKEIILRNVADIAADEDAIYNYLANKHGIS